MNATLKAVLAGALAAAALFLVLRLNCSGGPTKVEQRVDSTLATAPAWRDTVRVRDSALAADSVERLRLTLLSDAQGRRIRRELKRADSLQALADSMEAGLPVGSASDSVTNLLDVLDTQKRASVALRIVVDSLESRHTTDSTQLAHADATIERNRLDMAQDQRRIDRLTKDLRDLRDEGKDRGQFLGFLPSWTDEVLMVSTASLLAYKIGKSS